MHDVEVVVEEDGGLAPELPPGPGGEPGQEPVERSRQHKQANQQVPGWKVSQGYR